MPPTRTWCPAQASGLETLSLGGGSVASGNNAVVLGSNAQATADNAFAGGFGCHSAGDGRCRPWSGSSVTAANSAAIGTGSIAQRGGQTAYVESSVWPGHQLRRRSLDGRCRCGTSDHQCGGGLRRHGRRPMSGQVASAEMVAIGVSEGYTNARRQFNCLLVQQLRLQHLGQQRDPGAIAVGTGAARNRAKLDGGWSGQFR